MNWSARRVILFLMLGICAVTSGSRAADEGYETPSKLKASDVLPAEMQRGDHFHVMPGVENDGYMNHYTVASDYGEFEAYGDLSLMRLIRQIHALAQLDEISKSKVFLESAAKAATGQEFGGHPVTTVKGIPDGITHMFHKYKREAKQGYQAAKQVGGEAVDVVTPGEDDQKKEDSDDTKGDQESDPSDTEELRNQTTQAAEKYAEKWFGLNTSERQWYKKLEVDPYNRNPVLRKEVKTVATVDAAAHFGMKFVPIPSIPGVNYLSRVNDAVWNVDPEELRDQNIKLLQEAGVDEKLIAKFMTNEYLSPSQQTLVLATLTQMKGVKDLETVLRISAAADSFELAEFDLANALFLEAYHKFQTPVAKVFGGEPVPIFLDSDGHLNIIVSVDYAFWTEDLGEVITIMAKKFAEQEAETRQLWLRGRASARFEEAVKDLDWTLRQRISLEKKIEDKYLDPAHAKAKSDKKEKKPDLN